jgi:4-hydroxy-2-oxoheptanedioate aldolase
MEVEGVDGVFFGAADLAASFGYLGESNHPQIVAMIEDGLQQVARGNKAGGVLCGDKVLVARYRSAGARFIAVGVDSLLLAAATTALCSDYKFDPFARRPAGSY